MGRYTFRLPDIGEGIAEAEIVAWHVNVGDTVEEDGPLADMMTDKATVEMESPVSGTVLEVAGGVGDVVPIGAPLVVLEVEGEGNEAEGAAPEPSFTPTLARGARETPPQSRSVPKKPSPPGIRSGEGASGKALASPAVRARARDLGIDLSAVPAGPSGHVTHADLDAFLSERAPSVGAAEPAEVPLAEELSGAGERIKVVGLRRRIAEKMAASKRHIPHFSYVEECDVTALEDLRAELNALGKDRPRLTLLPFLIAAICRAVPDFPMINARFDDAGGVVTRYNSVHMGVATQTDAGLMVPVVRDAQAMGLWQLSAEIARLAQAARDGSATSEELSGSTLTITSLGALGGIASTPVINHPEVAIIGPNRIVERPMFVPDGAGGERVEKRKLMNISISCDHRVVDGWDAANFVQAVRQSLEAPMLLLAG
ncbi:MAG: 2-oxo acid dehydrogenase subunit E2 [Novosphingobium sp.]|nr:2-oxo acid dehydrogenase subunit E2 [Novosphingobium sp.]MCP5402907.1 2-oxo acid dehydrogenase subunit E2 [Novosphingobium sp.]